MEAIDTVFAVLILVRYDIDSSCEQPANQYAVLFGATVVLNTTFLILPDLACHRQLLGVDAVVFSNPL